MLLVDVAALIEKDQLGKIISLEASEHIMPWHGGFFMRNWRRKAAYSGGLLLKNVVMTLIFIP